MLAACLGMLADQVAAAPLGTPSGEVEVTLKGVDPRCVRAAILASLVDDGFAIAEANDVLIVGARNIDALEYERKLIFTIIQPSASFLRIVFRQESSWKSEFSRRRVNKIEPTQETQETIGSLAEKWRSECPAG